MTTVADRARIVLDGNPDVATLIETLSQLLAESESLRAEIERLRDERFREIIADPHLTDIQFL